MVKMFNRIVSKLLVLFTNVVIGDCATRNFRPISPAQVRSKSVLYK